jgi:hypothetical protein
MPLSTAQKVEALKVDFRSAAPLADMLGVSRSHKRVFVGRFPGKLL